MLLLRRNYLRALKKYTGNGSDIHKKEVHQCYVYKKFNFYSHLQ